MPFSYSNMKRKIFKGQIIKNRRSFYKVLKGELETNKKVLKTHVNQIRSVLFKKVAHFREICLVLRSGISRSSYCWTWFYGSCQPV